MNINLRDSDNLSSKEACDCLLTKIIWEIVLGKSINYPEIISVLIFRIFN